ncbi:MAG: hypothetical protein AMXMBFR80_24190 [Dehalococcoidia bacterium]
MEAGSDCGTGVASGGEPGLDQANVAALLPPADGAGNGTAESAVRIAHLAAAPRGGPRLLNRVAAGGGGDRGPAGILGAGGDGGEEPGVVLELVGNESARDARGPWLAPGDGGTGRGMAASRHST